MHREETEEKGKSAKRDQRWAWVRGRCNTIDQHGDARE